MSPYRPRTVDPAVASPAQACRRAETDRRPGPDSSHLDWSELGRLVRTEALRRAMDELATRNALGAAPAARGLPPEGRS